MKPEWMKPKGDGWKRVSAERVKFDNPWLTVVEQDAVAPTGKSALYGMVKFKNLAVGVVPIHADGSVTLVGQHRFVHNDYSWEIPEGGGALDIDPLESARRELAEEAGLAAAEWREVMRFQLSNSVTNEIGVGYLAWDLSEVPTAPDETEVIQVARRPFREALELALVGHMPDMITIAMLLRAYQMAQEGELPEALSRAMLRR